MNARTALITGATGVVGRNLLAHLLKEGGWEIIAVSRRQPSVSGHYVHCPIDLLDPSDCARQAQRLAAVTHVFHAAYVERADSTTWVRDNTAMLSNLIEAIDPVARGAYAFRPLLLPGLALLWPLVLRRWRQRLEG